MKRYFENFKSVEDVRREFGIADDMIKDEEILYAYYGYGSYCGSAMVLFERDGKLYEVRSSHCSCNGLEYSWDPQEVVWKQLAMRNLQYVFEEDTDGAAKEALLSLIAKNNN